MTDFGRHSYVSGFSFYGSTEPVDVEKMINAVIPAIGMTPIFDKKIFGWTEEGVGYIHIQCLYESCVLADIWPKHRGGYLLVISCKIYDIDIVARVMQENNYEPHIGQEFQLWL